MWHIFKYNPLRILEAKFLIYSIIKGKPFSRSGERKTCYIFLAADYGNLGDVAITYAQRRILKKWYSDYDIVEVPAGKTLSYIHHIKKNIKPEDIITVVGGGNMGDLYSDIELLRLMVVEQFRSNKVILFPQTMDYSNTNNAHWLLKRSCRIYSDHPDLLMMAREKISYMKMKRWYPTVNIILKPDVVMTLDERQDVHRENILTLCLRKDKEKQDNKHILDNILTQLDELNLNVEEYDTHIGGDRYSEEEKYSQLEKIWSQFRKSKLIITDRLHGMIFAYITGTPAIILPNSNFKVKGCYEWIKDCGNIKFIETINDFSINLGKSKMLDLGREFKSVVR